MSDPMEKNQPPGAHPADRAASKRIQTVVAGGVFIFLGLVFLVRNVTGFSLQNWWALFILIPAAGSLATAYSMFHRNGDRVTASSQGPLIGGLVLLAVTAIFLFDLDWGVVWPAFPILIGLSLILSSFGR